MTVVYQYNYHGSGRYPSSWLSFKTLHFRDWILSPSPGEICLGRSNRKVSLCLRTPPTTPRGSEDQSRLGISLYCVLVASYS
jgi:hypothetical protein